ncbi:MAG: hypothetical protein A2014_02010 [Spirochaetes bacterium GWF1_49_6]|nr:MAG: hypothetical protein A2014_02010 [Spirochaetes bacterium GWF1_49_6]
MAKAIGGKAATAPFSPHIHAPLTLHRIMWDVVIALIPATAAAIYFFGYNAAVVIGMSVGTAVVTELIMNIILKRPISIADGSAVITGLLFAFNLPPSAPWYVTVFGSMFAIAIVKWAFGGLGHNIMNPALGGRVFVLAAWSGAMVNVWSPTVPTMMSKGLSFLQASDVIVEKVPYVTNQVYSQISQISNTVQTNILTNQVTVDMITGASPLGSLKSMYETMSQATNAVQAVSHASHAAPAMAYSYWDLFIGNIPGCIGETSALAILLGAIYLIWRKVLIPVLPVVYIGTAALLTWIFGGLPMGLGWFAGDPLYHILSGGLFLGAFFMATDYVTSPMSVKGTLIYGFLLGTLTVIIRLWGGYPEGVSYSIVFMNFFVPIFDRYLKPKIYGKGKAAILVKGGAK